MQQIHEEVLYTDRNWYCWKYDNNTVAVIPRNHVMGLRLNKILRIYPLKGIFNTDEPVFRIRREDFHRMTEFRGIVSAIRALDVRNKAVAS